LILLAAMLGVVALGALLSRFILAQVRPLLMTNRALEQGVLSARTPVLGDDELGELARGINRMADSLQESHEMLESKVEERTRESHRLLQERSDFFAALSHELRTPLAVILAKSELLLAPVIGVTDGRVRDFSSTIHRSADQVLAVVNEILDLAKAESGHLEVALEDVSVAEEFDELHATIDGVVTAAGLTLSVDIPADLPPLRADRAHLRKMMLNLMDNAAKYTAAGGRVTIKAAARGSLIDVSVVDTGVGIPPKARDHVFDPFYRVPSTRTQRGQAATGLGLALTKRLAEAQGGSIGFTSRPGRGSTFTVSLPRAERIDASSTF
jgi:two-component system phosphate regulon sensor histidine kinase PhoR